LAPQQYASPALVMAQVKARPAATEAQAVPVPTRNGDELALVVPVPSSPIVLAPQQ
jgi:hypothetical protein